MISANRARASRIETVVMAVSVPSVTTRCTQRVNPSRYTNWHPCTAIGSAPAMTGVLWSIRALRTACRGPKMTTEDLP
jgi:hypothetical protein